MKLLSSLIRCLATLVFLTCAILGALAPAAHAHTVGPQFISVFDRVSPPEPGVKVEVASTGKAPRLVIICPRGHVLEIEGLDGEPFARIIAGKAQVNSRSPSRYMLTDPGGWPRAVHGKPQPEIKPLWRVAGTSNALVYWERRAEWPLIGPPDAARRLGKRVTIERWAIPATYDGGPIQILGHVDWSPPGLNFEVVALGATFVVFLGFAFVGKWKERAVKNVSGRPAK